MLHVHTLQEAEERLVTYQDPDPDGDCSTCDEMMATRVLDELQRLRAAEQDIRALTRGNLYVESAKVLAILDGQ